MLFHIPPIDEKARQLARERQDSLVKPIGSLGVMEELSIQLAGITGKVVPDISRKCVVVMAADNGIWEEGISPVPQSVTALLADNMQRGLTGVAVLCRQAQADVLVVDVGIKEPYSMPGIFPYNIRKGTANIAKGPAMTREEALQAINVGLKMAEHCQQKGYAVVGVGEIGICNTSTSAAVLCALTGADPELVTGMGVGLTPEVYARKKACVSAALAVNQPDSGDVVDVLAKVGGLDIAAMCGLFLGCAERGLPVVVDGFISIVAALCAHRLDGRVRDYLFPSHASQEAGYTIAAKALQLEPIFQLNMRMGEGSGCPLTFQLLDDACAIMRDMGTFAQGNIDDSTLVDIR